MQATVFFIKWEDKWQDKLKKIVKRMGIKKEKVSAPIAGVKTHFGEEGNKTYLSPSWIGEIIKFLKEENLSPVLIETTTLYRGKRQDAVSHLNLAYAHGFTFDRVHAPIIIADGMRGEEDMEIPINLPHVKKAKIGRGVKGINIFIGISHFKGHMLTGFGGTLKNFAMGLSSKRGKLEMHSLSKPYIEETKCTACGECYRYCPHEAVVKKNAIFSITPSKCTGCGGCITICPEGAVKIKWNEASENVQKKVAEYFLAITRGKPGLYINFLVNITKECDCFPSKGNDIITEDKGIMVSLDPVAIDQASFDLIKEEILKAHPEINPEIQLEHAEKIGAGTRNYKIKEV